MVYVAQQIGLGNWLETSKTDFFSRIEAHIHWNVFRTRYLGATINDCAISDQDRL